MTRRALLVEGYTDTLFIRGVFKVTGIRDVDVTPPKERGALGNGISNVISLLPVMLAKLQSGDFDCFGVLVDADYSGLNGGFAQRRQEIASVLIAAGYSHRVLIPSHSFGDEYFHPTQIPVHVGIFPDHASDGMVEHLLSDSIKAGQQSTLFTYAQTCLAALPVVLYKHALHSKKAEIATLLAWQFSPGLDTGIAVKTDVFDVTQPNFANFVAWLKRVFP